MPDTDDFTLWIGKRMWELCRERHMGIAQLSSCTGIAQTTLKRMRRGIGNPKMLTIVKICRALDIPLSAFFTEEKEGATLWYTLD